MHDAHSTDTKVNDLVTLTLILKLKIAFWTLLTPGHSVSQIHLDLLTCKYRKSVLLICTHNVESDLINNMDHMRISASEPSSVILGKIV